MLRYILLLNTLILLLNTAVSQPGNQPSAENIKKHLQTLASDELKGRKSGSDEALKAAKYISAALKKCQVKPLFDKGFQYFEVVKDYQLGKNNYLKTSTSSAQPRIDYIPLTFSVDTQLSTELVFAGYGFDIQTDKFKWNDFEHLDVRGKIVVLLNGEPDLKDRNNPFSDYSSDSYKVMLASDKGAAGVIFIYPSTEKKANQLPVLYFNKSHQRAKIAVVQMTPDFANKAIFSDSNKIELLEKKIQENKSPCSFVIPTTVSLAVEIIENKGKTCNIAGIIPGRDPYLKNEYIVVGAHYDHLGMGGPGSGSRFPDTFAVHNGADDNASGVAAVLELACRLSSEKTQLKRSIIFVAFSGEEMGLLGSSKFVSNPPVPLTQIKAMINLDMVGRLDTLSHYLLIGGTGTAKENDSLFKIFGEKHSFDFKFSPEGLGPSDHASFYAHNIPVLFVTTGAHEDYHSWTDDENKINYEGLKKVIDFVYDVIISYVNLPQGLTFQEAGPKTRSSSGNYKVTLGILPDFSASDIKGLKVKSVRSGGPAQLSGMQNEDIIISINGAEVNNIYDYMNRLKIYRPGDQITVDILRKGTKITLFVQL